MLELPDYFVWHIVGTESSLTLEDNFASLEAQRQQNPDGMFLWGCGNSIGQKTLSTLLKATDQNPLLVFTPIKSAPRQKDRTHLNSDSKTVCLWQTIETPDFHFPIGAQVVSTAENDQGGEQQKKSHYAFVCRSNKPLIPDMNSPRTLNPGFLETVPCGRNPVNSASVKVVHKTQDQKYKNDEYRIILSVSLVHPFIVKMKNPRILHNVSINPVTGQYPV